MEINQAVESLRQFLKANNDFEDNPIDLNLPVIPPFQGKEKIKLIILGQDPTIKNVNSRSKITCTLNLNKNNALRFYVENICAKLGITIENVYATNLFKYFYTNPPAKTIKVLKGHLAPNLELLQKELVDFKNIPIITLGEPVLQLISHEKAKVRSFWGYNNLTRTTAGSYSFARLKDNQLNCDFFPFPHQPSIRKEFYRNTIDGYLEYVKGNIQIN